MQHTMDAMASLPPAAKQAALAAMQGQLLTSQDARPGLKRNAGFDVEHFGQQRTREELFAQHNNALKGMKRQALEPVSFSTTCSQNVKPKTSVSGAWAACTPIPVSALHENSTHKRRQLQGTLVVAPLVMSSIMSILEDEDGSVVKVAFYGMLPEDLPKPSKIAFAERHFPRGTVLAIKEPFYKLMADGTHGVRVDNPMEVAFLERLGPHNVEGWQERAQRHFKDKEYRMAADCYSKAISLLDQTPSHNGPGESQNGPGQQRGGLAEGGIGPLTALLLNLSGTHLKLGQAEHALATASAAAALNKSCSKAHYRVALALDALGHPAAALCSMHAAAALCPSRAAADQLFAALRSPPPSRKGRSSAASDESGSAEARLEMLRAVASSQTQFGTDGGAAPKASQESSAADSLAMKEAANELFRTGQFLGALAGYRDALHALPGQESVAVLLAYRAECWLNGEDLAAAMLDAGASLLLDPSLVEAHYRRTLALLQLGLLPEAEAACTLGLRTCHGNADLQMLQTCIEAAKQPTAPQEKGGREKEGRQRKQAGPVPKGKAAGSVGPTEGGPSSSGAVVGAAEGEAAGSPADQAVRGGPTGLGSGKKSRKGKAAKGKGKAPGTEATDGRGTTGKAAAGPANAAAQAKPSKQVSEREMVEMRERDSAGLEQMVMMKQMRAMLAAADPGAAAKLPPEMAAAMQLDERVAPFHDEFSKEGRWPSQVDIRACQRYLRGAYETARSLNLQLLGMLDPDGLSMLDVVTRLGGNDDERLEWLCESEMGSVRFFRRLGYDRRVFHSFGNVSARSEFLTPGTTHVAVGFVDLGGLAAACQTLDGQVSQRLSGSSQGGGRVGGEEGVAPLTWVGYESSPYAVAKTLVVSRMLLAGCRDDDILQVWYSAAWSRSALRAFRLTLTAILGSPEAAALPSPVQVLLRHWQSKDVSLAQARTAWFASLGRANAGLGGFRAKADRMALCGYTLTGQLLEGEVGSVVMFAIPKEGGYGERSLDENFLETLQAHEVLKLRTLGSAPDVVAAGVMLLRERIGRLGRLMRAGKVMVQVRLGAVEPGDSATHTEIRRLAPYTMSWSNICDYVSPQAFHAMARACSAPHDTVHHLHTMNWVRDVKGASFMDYALSFRKGPELTQRMLHLWEMGKDGIQMLYQNLGWASLVLAPPVDDPRNVVDASLSTVFHKVWVEKFFACAGLAIPKAQVQVVGPPTYSMFSRSNTTMDIIYTFDSSVNFQQQHL